MHFQATARSMALGFTAALCSWPVAKGQNNQPPVREHVVILVPNNVLSVRTDRIRARAQFLQAMGDFQESIGIARIYHAQAQQMEIRNHAEWVRTYFALKDLNKAYRRKENPPHLDRQAVAEEQLKRLHTANPHLLAGQEDSHECLNWFLREIGGRMLAAALLGQQVGQGLSDEPLSAGEIHQIMVREGPGGRQRVFRADEAVPLEARWPFLLRGPEFTRLRVAFEQTRDQAIEQLRGGGQINYDTQIALRKSVDDLRFTLEKTCPRLRRTDAKVWPDYKLARHYLDALAMSVYRAVDVNDRQLLDDSIRFHGETVGELIVHLCRNGLEFAPAQSGGERIYRKLSTAMRNIYLDMQPPGP